MSDEATPRKILILGALSAIAIASARRLAPTGASFVLVARNEAALKREAADLIARGAAQVEIITVDLATPGDRDALIAKASKLMSGLDTLWLFYGYLGDQTAAETYPDEAARIIEVNYTSAANWILASVPHLEKAGRRGVLLTASSVAGDRGRRSNYVYGSAKAGLSVLMQGLAQKWAARSDAPRAVNLKLGFVDTPMTDGLEKSGPLWASPQSIAAYVEKASEKGGPIIYAPWFWRFIMMAVRLTPNVIFRRVNL